MPRVYTVDNDDYELIIENNCKVLHQNILTAITSSQDAKASLPCYCVLPPPPIHPSPPPHNNLPTHHLGTLTLTSFHAPSRNPNPNLLGPISL